MIEWIIYMWMSHLCVGHLCGADAGDGHVVPVVMWSRDAQIGEVIGHVVLSLRDRPDEVLHLRPIRACCLNTVLGDRENMKLYCMFI